MTAPTPPTDTPVPIGPYRLFHALKKGGMARVYLALHIDRPDELLAVKTLLPELTSKASFRDMFTTEGKVGQRLEHPNIVRTYDHGTAEGTAFIAMEYIKGFDLSTLMRRLRKQGQPIPLPAALTIAHEVAEGLAYAHELTDEHGRPLELVNRDVSPGNIMITPDGRTRLIDFGIAQTTIDVRSQIGAIKGKISYMSPEQVRGLPVDQRSDLFSLGTVLYQLLTGVNVFHDDGDFATMERVRQASAPPPSHHRGDVDPALDALIGRAMARQAGDRHPSARALLHDLREYMKARGIEIDRAAVGELLQRTLTKRLATLEADIERTHDRALITLGLRQRPETGPMEMLPPMEEAPKPRDHRRWWALGAVAAVAVAAVVFIITRGA